MIHGHKKTKKQKSQQEIKDENQLSLKINSKLAQFFTINRKEISSQQTPKYLEFISLLMQLCTDIPTIFNFRRELILKTMEGLTPSEVGQLLGGQIKLTTKLIQSDTKSYTIWSYRQWLVRSLFEINQKIIKAEKELIKMLLMKDQKNFHAWNYRNWLNSIQSFIDQDLAFTEEKIKSNPFNFSPYHFRTKFIPQKYAAQLKQLKDQTIRSEIIIFGMPKQILQQQFQSVKTAIFLNPNQEAPWLYYNWLLSQLVPAFVVSQSEEQGKLTISFNMKVSGFQKFIVGDFQNLSGKSGNKNSEVWQVKKLGPTLTIKSNLVNYQKVRLQSDGNYFAGNDITCEWIDENIKSIFKRQLQFIDEVIQSEQNICRFAYLQKATLYKLTLQCGTHEQQFNQTVRNGHQTIRAIEKQVKAQKYTKKLLEYWSRISKGELNAIQKSLKHKFSK